MYGAFPCPGTHPPACGTLYPPRDTLKRASNDAPGNPAGPGVGPAPRVHFFLSNGKIVSQSSFMLMTVQPFFLASSISDTLKVPIFDSAP